MGNLIENKIKHYTDQIYSSGPVTMSDYTNGRYDKVHDELYQDAINKLIKKIASDEYDEIVKNNFILSKSQLDVMPLFNMRFTREDYIEAYYKWVKRTHKIIEVKGNEYFNPSSVIIINKEFPFDKKRYKLDDYWNYGESFQYEKTKDELMIDDETLKYAELIYVDYIKGKCKFKSKLNGEVFWVSFDYINDLNDINKFMTLNNTFTYKLLNNKLGY